MKNLIKILPVIVTVIILLLSSCGTQQKTIMVAGQKVPVKTYTDEQIQADAWVLTYMTCETELMKYKYGLDTNNSKLKFDVLQSERNRKLFFNKMYVRYFQDSVYKRKFLSYQKEGRKLFRPCQQINAINQMNNRKK
jgi:hypothetical protein